MVMGTAKHWVVQSHGRLLVPDSTTEHLMPQKTTHRGCVQEEHEQGTMGGWICSITNVEGPLVSTGGCDSCLNNSAGWWQGKTLFSGLSKNGVDLLDKKFWGRGTLPLEVE